MAEHQTKSPLTIAAEYINRLDAVSKERFLDAHAWEQQRCQLTTNLQMSEAERQALTQEIERLRSHVEQYKGLQFEEVQRSAGLRDELATVKQEQEQRTMKAIDDYTKMYQTQALEDNEKIHCLEKEKRKLVQKYDDFKTEARAIGNRLEAQAKKSEDKAKASQAKISELESRLETMEENFIMDKVDWQENLHAQKMDNYREITGVRLELQARTEELRTVKAELATTQTELATTQTELATTKTELATTQKRLADTRAIYDVQHTKIVQEELAKANERHAQHLKKVAADHNTKIASLTTDHGSKITMLNVKHHEAVLKIKHSVDEKIATLQAQHDDQTRIRDKAAKDELQDKIQAYATRCGAQIHDLQGEILRLGEEKIKTEEELRAQNNHLLTKLADAVRKASDWNTISELQEQRIAALQLQLRADADAIPPPLVSADAIPPPLVSADVDPQVLAAQAEADQLHEIVAEQDARIGSLESLLDSQTRDFFQLVDDHRRVTDPLPQPVPACPTVSDLVVRRSTRARKAPEYFKE